MRARMRGRAVTAFLPTAVTISKIPPTLDVILSNLCAPAFLKYPYKRSYERPDLMAWFLRIILPINWAYSVAKRVALGELGQRPNTALQLTRPACVIQEIAASARRVAELKPTRSAFEFKNPLFWIMPVNPLVGDRCGKGIDPAVVEIDGYRPACSARGIGAAQVEDSARGRPAVTG